MWRCRRAISQSVARWTKAATSRSHQQSGLLAAQPAMPADTCSHPHHWQYKSASANTNWRWRWHRPPYLRTTSCLPITNGRMEFSQALLSMGCKRLGTAYCPCCRIRTAIASDAAATRQFGCSFGQVAWSARPSGKPTDHGRATLPIAASSSPWQHVDLPVHYR